MAWLNYSLPYSYTPYPRQSTTPYTLHDSVVLFSKVLYFEGCGRPAAKVATSANKITGKSV